MFHARGLLRCHRETDRKTSSANISATNDTNFHEFDMLFLVLTDSVEGIHTGTGGGNKEIMKPIIMVDEAIQLMSR